MSVAIQETLPRRKFLELTAATAGAASAALVFYWFLKEETLALEVLDFEIKSPPLPKPLAESGQTVSSQREKEALKAALKPQIREFRKISIEKPALTRKSLPFFSQFNPEMPQDIKSMGCGPVSLAMEVAFREKVPSTLEATRNVCRRARCLGLWSAAGTNTEKLEKLAKTYGINAQHKSLASLEEMEKVINTTGHPVIAGVNVDCNPDKIGHLILVLKVDRENGLVYTHDSATQPPENGENRAYDLAIFKNSWETQGRWIVSFGEDFVPFDKDGFPLYLLPSVLAWRENIKKWSKEHSVDAKAIAALIQIESAGNAKIVSPSGAQGLFQVMPYHFPADETNHFDPDINAKTGLEYFKKCLAVATSKGYKDADLLAEAARGYNGGTKAIGTTTDPEADLFSKRFRAFYTGDHPEIDKFYYHYATHL